MNSGSHQIKIETHDSDVKSEQTGSCIEVDENTKSKTINTDIWNLDSCEKSGLEPNICEKAGFMQLPSDLKLNIVELLAGVDIARVCCTCSEIRNLASSDELWKVKYGEEFGIDVKNKCERGWKWTFAMHCWMERIKRICGWTEEQLKLRRGLRYDRQPFAPHDMWLNGAGKPLLRWLEDDHHLFVSTVASKLPCVPIHCLIEPLCDLSYPSLGLVYTSL